MNERPSDVEEKTLQDVLMCGFRMKGKYEEIGKGFSKVGKAMGFNISGKAFGLYYDEGYKEEGADFEACMPIKKDNFSIRRFTEEMNLKVIFGACTYVA